MNADLRILEDDSIAVTYECASCHGMFEAPMNHFYGFIQSVRLAASMGRDGNKFHYDRVPTVNACCPECFRRIM